MGKILLVEDDPMESRLYQNLFTKEGFEVVAIDNGHDCREKTLEVKPDVILLDIMMPKMNGLDALDVLRFDPETKKYPVIILTNLSDQHYQDEAAKRGATMYIIKSQIENKVLVQKVRDVIGVYAPKSP
ncbi:hypothetical protein A3A63_03120 [Candidatus Gottesmanbacteria bacterium RIFCSPLOWO2_01_FULL_46_9]|uniref:Response regulatory domain-containing protein n=1 Tax=Candidatus Gottesmanbacteria bacterium RIFCSPLOWO2_01_FULL_46_9 TaxID=1798394 RepID=A0A1F6AYK9_9BACT|nr:MAG: hypothetical protein A3A63_03120 [Candidatus Gottesmanbacteria bacterium RIFCSPLOWO2_01_FULL_46_9]